MKLYYAKGACSLTVRIIIHELGLHCEYEAVELRTKKTETGIDYFTINSKGGVPALQLDNGEILTENTAILQYLADSNKAEQLLPLLGNFQRYRVLEWLSFISSDLHKGCGALFNPQIPQELKEAVFRPNIKKHFSWVDTQIGKRNYLVGDHFTLADAFLYVIVSWFPHLGIDFTGLSNLERYFAELGQRKSIVQAFTEEKLR